MEYVLPGAIKIRLKSILGEGETMRNATFQQDTSTTLFHAIVKDLHKTFHIFVLRTVTLLFNP